MKERVLLTTGKFDIHTQNCNWMICLLKLNGELIMSLINAQRRPLKSNGNSWEWDRKMKGMTTKAWLEKMALEQRCLPPSLMT